MTERNLRSEKEIEIANKQGGRDENSFINNFSYPLVYKFASNFNCIFVPVTLSKQRNKTLKIVFFVRLFSTQNLCIAACAILKPN